MHDGSLLGQPEFICQRVAFTKARPGDTHGPMSPSKPTRLGAIVTTETRVVMPAWRTWARDQIKHLPHGTQAKVAREIGVSTGYIADILSGRAKVSGKLGELEAALIARGASPPILSRELAMVRDLIERASPESREYLLAAADILLNQNDSDAKQALVALLRTFVKRR